MLQQTDWLATELEELTSSRADSPARISASLENAAACQVSAAASGPSFTESLLKFDRVGLSLRTFLGSELSELMQCSMTWQEQITPLGRWWWVLSMPELRTDGSGFGLLPTAKASDGRPKGNGGNRKSPGLDQLAKAGMLPTPTAMDATNRGYQYSQGDKSKPVLTLPGAVGAATSPQNGPGTGRLSPCFVEWMMGYPAGWTDVSD